MEIKDQNVVQMENGNITYSVWDFKGELDYVDKWFLMRSPMPIIFITTVYLLFVLKLGPDYMKERKPKKLTNILAFYNFMQVILSSLYFASAAQTMMSNGFVPTTCSMESEESRNRVAIMVYNYFLCKVIDLLDTIFFVLRKKQSQVTFLHVYHHVLILCASWLYLKYEPVPLMLFLGTINSFVHIIMYAYYGLSAFPSMTKYLWWKKYITRLQILQFTLILIHYFITQATSQCRPSYVLTTVVWLNGPLFIYLFGKFYVNAYIKRNNSKLADHNGLKMENYYTNKIN